MSKKIVQLNPEGSVGHVLLELAQKSGRMTSIIVAFTVKDEAGEEMIETCWSRQTLGDAMWAIEVLKDGLKR